MEFEKVNPLFVLALCGVIITELSLVYTHQDGTLLKLGLVLMGVAMGLPIQLQDLLHGGKKPI